MVRLKICLVLITVLLFSGCAALLPQFETPTVVVTDFRVLPGQSIVPAFEIGLHVSNPNRSALKLVGLAYRVELEGHQILTGVASDLPVIAAYGEGDVVLQARPDLFSTFNLFQDLLRRPRETVSFTVEAALDVGGLVPKIRVREEGTVSLSEGIR